MAKLLLVKGGKLSAKSGAGGKTPPPGKTKGRGGGKKNPLNDLLFAAVSRMFKDARAASVEEIAERMTRYSKKVIGIHRFIDQATANFLLYDCRRRKHFHGWMPMHVEKGAVGINRGYVSVLVGTNGYDEELYLIDTRDVEFVEAGLRSSISTSASMIANDAEGLTMYIGVLEALGRRSDADRIRELAAECRGFQRRAAEILREVMKL
jgi:hypothetical protein